MVFLITQSNRQLYRKELDQIFRLRHEVLVETLAWKGLSANRGRERDQFDNSEALYLGTYDQSRNVVGCMRLNPTTGPSLTATVFKRMVQFRDFPISPTVYDVTRYVVSPRVQASGQAVFHGVDLVCAAFEFGLSEGWTEFTAVLSAPLFSSMLQNGVEVNALGFPERFDGHDHIAVSMPIKERSLQKLYEGSGGCRPRLVSVTFRDPEVLSDVSLLI